MNVNRELVSDAIPATTRSGAVLALQVAAIVITTGGLWLAAGMSGLLAGFALGIPLIVLGPLAVFIVGHLVLLFLLPRGLPAMETLLFVEAGLGTVLVTSLIEYPERIISFIALWVALSGIALLGPGLLGEPWAGGAILVGILGFAGYFLHRYEYTEVQFVRERP